MSTAFTTNTLTTNRIVNTGNFTGNTWMGTGTVNISLVPDGVTWASLKLGDINEKLYMEIGQYTTNSCNFIIFHSNKNTLAVDAQILCFGQGSGGQYTGKLEYYAASHNFNGDSFFSGILGMGYSNNTIKLVPSLPGYDTHKLSFNIKGNDCFSLQCDYNGFQSHNFYGPLTLNSTTYEQNVLKCSFPVAATGQSQNYISIIGSGDYGGFFGAGIIQGDSACVSLGIYNGVLGKTTLLLCKNSGLYPKGPCYFDTSSIWNAGIYSSKLGSGLDAQNNAISNAALNSCKLSSTLDCNDNTITNCKQISYFPASGVNYGLIIGDSSYSLTYASAKIYNTCIFYGYSNSTYPNRNTFVNAMPTDYVDIGYSSLVKTTSNPYLTTSYASILSIGIGCKGVFDVKCSLGVSYIGSGYFANFAISTSSTGLDTDAFQHVIPTSFSGLSMTISRTITVTSSFGLTVYLIAKGNAANSSYIQTGAQLQVTRIA